MNDNKTNINELKNVVKKFCDDRNWDQFHNPKDVAIGISSESAELLDLFRFKSEAEINEMMSDIKKREMIGEELADIIFMSLRFAQKFNFDISDELQSKINKNAKKYPIEKSKGSNKKYNEL